MQQADQTTGSSLTCALQLQPLVLNDYVDSSFPDRLDEGSVVTLVLVGIFNRELTNCVIEA